MVLDSLSNSAKYEGLHPAFKEAFEFVKNTDFSNIEPGKIEIDGDLLFVNNAQITGKTSEDAKMETHRDYIDIQIPLTQSETMGWIPACDLKQPNGEYNEVKDITFFHDKATAFVNVEPGQFAIFFPEDGHQPGIGEGTYRKLIVKVRI